MTKKNTNKKKSTLRSFLLGDIWVTGFLTRHIRLLSLILAFVIFYIHNRYASQKEMIKIDKLKHDLIDIRYDALTRSSELLERTRQSRIEEYISEKGSDLQTPTNPPYLIK
ncbi:hypothetical protein EZS27_001440 [termite gut metagenome]|uniref:Cell division protein FtsL n=1 Tax=termite gut metagenome TaxID=433724 RepID=A0A5J4SZ40_9ZZZZ